MKRTNRFEMLCAYLAAAVSASLFALIGWRVVRDLVHAARVVYHILLS